MGWNSWDCFGGAVTEDEVVANAEYMAAELKQFGWDTVVVDIQWYEPDPGLHHYNDVADPVLDAWGGSSRPRTGSRRPRTARSRRWPTASTRWA